MTQWLRLVLVLVAGVGLTLVLSPAPAGQVGTDSTSPGVTLTPGPFINGAGTARAAIGFPDGTAAAPSRTYTNDDDLGSYRIGANNEGFAAGGVLRWDYNTTRLLSTLPLLFTDNTVDIGASGVTRPRTGYFATSLIQGGALNLGTTTTAGVTLTNTTAAAAGAQQYSPGLSQIGQGWKTDATAASQPVETRWELRPVEGAAAPTYTVALTGRINNGAWTDLITSTSGGTVTTAGEVRGTALRSDASGNIYWAGRIILVSTNNGMMNVLDNSSAFGIQINVGTAAPTISSGGGTAPAIVTSPPSRNTTGAVDIGTGGAASQIVILFGAPPWTNAPHCQAWVETTTAGNVRAHGVVATTTTMTIQAASAWAASAIVAWKCEATV